MKQLLQEIGDDWIAVIDLAAIVAGVPGKRVSKSVTNGTRRRCKQLAEAGLVEFGYQNEMTGAVWEKPGEQQARLVVRRVAAESQAP